MHESAYGTKRTFRDDPLFVRFRGKADTRCRLALMARGAHARDRPTYHAIANIKIAATAAAMPCLTCTRSEPGSKPGKKSGSASAGTNQYKMATKANANPKISATTRICTPRISDRPRHIDQTRAGSILVNCVSDWHCQAAAPRCAGEFMAAADLGW